MQHQSYKKSYEIFAHALAIDPENIELLNAQGCFALNVFKDAHIGFADKNHLHCAIESFTQILRLSKKDTQIYVDAKLNRATAYTLLFKQQNELNGVDVDDSFCKALLELNEVSIRPNNSTININENRLHGMLWDILVVFSEESLKVLETLSLEDEYFLLTQLPNDKTILGETFDLVQKYKVKMAASTLKESVTDKAIEKCESLKSKIDNRIDVIFEKLKLFKKAKWERNENSFFYYMPQEIIDLVQETFMKEVVIDAKPGPGKNH